MPVALFAARWTAVIVVSGGSSASQETEERFAVGVLDCPMDSSSPAVSGLVGPDTRLSAAASRQRVQQRTPKFTLTVIYL